MGVGWRRRLALGSAAALLSDGGLGCAEVPATPEVPGAPSDGGEAAPTAPAEAPGTTSWFGETTSQGGSPLVVCLDAWAADAAVIEVGWPAFGRSTLERGVPVAEGCGGAALAEGARLAGRPCRSIDATVPDPHPLYDYTDRTRTRCVSGPEGAWCKLSYTGWFALVRGPCPRDRWTAR